MVAEGVEDQAQLDVLRSMGCHQIQGFLVSKPMAAPEVLAWLLRQAPQPGTVDLDLRGPGSWPPGPAGRQAGAVHKYRRAAGPQRRAIRKYRRTATLASGVPSDR